MKIKRICMKMVCFFLCMVILGSSTLMVGAVYTTKEQVADIGKGKPDLIIEKIVIEPGDIPFTQDLYCRVKNIGDAIAYKTIWIKSDIYRCILLGKIPINFIGTETGGGNFVSGLRPGETINIPFAHSEDLPKFGFFKFSCEVNPDKTIDESIISNNFYSENLFVFLGSWSK